MTTQVRRIEIKVSSDSKELSALAKGFSQVNKSVKETTSVLTSFRNVFIGLQGLSFAGFGLSSLVDLSDNVQKLRDRLNALEGGTTQGGIALEKLTQVANATNSSVEDLATVYARLGNALSETGISTDALLGLTQTLQNTFRLSGASAAEAAASTIQLSQGLASGQVRGQELRSVLEQNVVVGKLLAQQFGVTRGELLKFAEKRGGFTAVEVLQALARGSDEVNEKAKALQPTIREALTTAFNDLKVSLEAANREFGITQTIVSAIQGSADFVKEYGVILVGVGAAYLVYAKGALVAATATGIFSAALASTFTGVIVKAGVVIAGFIASIGVVPITLGAIAVALAGVASQIEPVQKVFESIRDTIAGGLEDAYFQDIERQNASFAKLNKTVGEYGIVGNEFQTQLANTFNALRKGEAPFKSFVDQFKEFARTAQTDKQLFNFQAELAKINEQFSKDKNISNYRSALRSLEIRKLDDDFKKGLITLTEYNKRLEEIQIGKVRRRSQEVRDELADLNAEFGKTSNIGAYSEALRDLRLTRIEKDFKEGRASLNDLNKAYSDNKLADYNQALNRNVITLREFNQLNSDETVAQINREVRAGTASWYEYDKAVVQTSERFAPGSAIRVGLQDYATQAGTLNQNIAQGITQTFSRLEDSLIEFTKSGKFEFAKFTQSILEDLNRIILRSLILRPLAQGLINFASPAASPGVSTVGQTDLATGSSSNVAARGAAFEGGRSNFFANGGVVNGRTNFKFGMGSNGVMGEAGPEAILPLSRNSNGELGVATSGSPTVNVNVINNASDTETRQREVVDNDGNKTIEIMIINKVKEGLANGSFDRQFQTQYNLKRRGA